MWMYRELQSANSTREWVACKAKSVESVMRAASRAQAFQGGVLEVGLWHSGGRVSRHMVKKNGKWSPDFDRDCA